MSSDLEKVIAQEKALRFKEFNEDIAFALGSAIREAVHEAGRGLAISVRLWDRPLFFAATAGTSATNIHWIERKANTVKLTMKSTYRIVLERGDRPRMFEPEWGVDVKDFAIAGGGFPIHVEGVGVIGAVIGSGLPERDDHYFVTAGLCKVLGQDFGQLALPPAV